MPRKHKDGNGAEDASCGIEFDFQGLPYGLNQMLRSHWKTRTAIKDYYAMLFRVGQKRAVEPCDVTVTWRVTQPMDWDNAAARFKCVGDAMVCAGVLSDDSPRVIRSFQVKQIQVKHRSEQGFTVCVVPALPNGNGQMGPNPHCEAHESHFQ